MAAVSEIICIDKTSLYSCVVLTKHALVDKIHHCNVQDLFNINEITSAVIRYIQYDMYSYIESCGLTV